MNDKLLYQWEEEIANNMSCLNSWQVANVALFSLGVMKAESSLQQQIARQLVVSEREESNTRRLRRFLANEKVKMGELFGEWSRWIVEKMGKKRVILSVDETKLGDRLGAMVVGVTWQGRCIPLAWRCYVEGDKEAYPAEGQVGVIAKLLAQIKAGLAAETEVILLADRGIGNSSDLCRAVSKLGWYFLFRVTANSKIVIGKQKKRITELVQPGESGTVSGILFASKHAFDGHAHVIWDKPHDQPWALVTNHPKLKARLYAERNWQEQCFRDLKSGGWQWERSRVRHPEHMERLMLILVMATAICLALGSLAVHLGYSRNLVKRSPTQWRRHWSLFKEGIAFFFEHILRGSRLISLQFWPDPRFV